MTDAAVPPVADLLNLKGAVALVTGAAAGIGAGIARRLAAAGAAVAVHYRSQEEAAHALVARLEQAGGRAAAIRAELTDPAAAEALVQEAAERLGPVTILVNNAARQTHSSLQEMSLGEWQAMMAANLDAVFLTTRAVTAPLIAAGRGGAVVNIASIEGLLPAATHGHYATTKAGLIMLTRAAAMEFGPHGIRVNAVSPGLIRRDGIEQAWPDGVKRWLAAVPLGRMGEDEDIGDAVLFLASPAARWVTGANLVVDGGITARPTY